MTKNKILISGYYGFDNFGDDAILQTIISNLKKIVPKVEITAISNNPQKTVKEFGVNSAYTFAFIEIIKKMFCCNTFISGGGSLLQNTTSTKSLLYYLSLLLFAKISGKKTFIYAQGIGPINGKIPVFLTKNILKMVDKVTVRDAQSQNLLNSWNVKSILTADPVWNMEIIEKHASDKIRVGIQLREWSSLSNEKLENFAQSIKACFDSEKYQLIIIPLQENKDDKVCNSLKDILQDKLKCNNVEIVSKNTIFEKMEQLCNLDLLIGMRFHACLVTIKSAIPTIAISYDPKVTALAQDSCIPYLDLDDMNKDSLVSKINELKENKNEIRENLITFSIQKAQEARQTDDLLLNILLK